MADSPKLSLFSIERLRPLRKSMLAKKLLLYGLLAVLVSGGYGLIVAGLGILLTGSIFQTSPFFNGLIFFLLALAVYPLRRNLEELVETVFHFGGRNLSGRLQAFSSELNRSTGEDEILAVFRKYIQLAFSPAGLHLFVHDLASDQYLNVPDSSGRLTSELSFSPASPLVQTLRERAAPFTLPDGEDLPQALAGEQTRLALLAAQVFAPLAGRERLVGWAALSGAPLRLERGAEEQAYLKSLSDQTALAIERAQLIAFMENRMREMDVLARITQGVNITLRLDDILEMIYAQTNQIVPTGDFHICIREQETDGLIDIFSVVNNERLDQLDNPPRQDHWTIEQSIIEQRRPILTDDYEQECRRLGVLPAESGLYAWLGVPLNAGAETIGVLSLGSRDAAVLYTAEQLRLVQTIADQAAGAIVKARLFEESQRRAHQLAALNEVSRQIAATLELNPLLQNIIRSSLEILSCEAGRLFLVDDTSGDLICRAALGMPAAGWLNRRLVAEDRAAAEVVRSRQAVICNDLMVTAEGVTAGDGQTAYTARAAMALPLEYQGDVIGVIEVFDQSPFNREDQDLLMALAGQAAMAVENARLYTMTDQALAARVEELSVMQRIDRELNTSLDTRRTMSITLEWALRLSSADAGLIGFTQEDGIHVEVSYGYKTEIETLGEPPWLLAFFELETLADQAAVSFRLLSDEGKGGLLQGAHSQIILPIRREASTIGLLLLESRSADPYSDETLGLLQRLSDHAATAISNAQLYAVVQSANIAKSEFVSFVSHELKNPMTSIKGFSELLAAGAVGPINEAQANFLATIRSNVERMSTLVSDLADVSRIEAGRLRLDFNSVSLREVVDEIVRSLRRQIEEKNQRLVIELPEEMSLLWADRTRLAQILTNLVSNASKYTPNEGEIRVQAEVCDNHWDEKGAPKVAHICVQDNGIGLSAEDRKKIFTKFFRSEDPLTREAPGTGLGLNITKSLVEFQGGKIWFESEHRKGTAFHFTVPLSV